MATGTASSPPADSAMATLSSTPIVIDGKGHLLGRLAPPDARLYPPALQGIAKCRVSGGEAMIIEV
ncbi:hypothetical protein C8J57DRAFT_1512326 [Mycena rebaudengoi]|nr:hypothetical protein C8J57DRAFT_1512326 [Mycena rebaudengoi]